MTGYLGDKSVLGGGDKQSTPAIHVYTQRKGGNRENTQAQTNLTSQKKFARFHEGRGPYKPPEKRQFGG